MPAISFLLPSGSLKEPVRTFLAKAGYDTHAPDAQGSCGKTPDRRIEFFERDRRMIPSLIAGRFHAGITGLDLLLESGITGLRTIAPLCFARRTNQPTRWVLAYGPWHGLDLEEAHGEKMPACVGCELPRLAEKLLAERAASLGRYEITNIRRIEGDEERSIADGLCDLVMLVTETGKSLLEHKLSIVPGFENMLVSTPLILAKQGLTPFQEEALQEVSFALQSVIGAANHVMLKADLPQDRLANLQLPAEISPTISPLGREGWVAVELCIPRRSIGPVGLKLERAGARAIVAQDVIAFSSGKASADSSVPG